MKMKIILLLIIALGYNSLLFPQENILNIAITNKNLSIQNTKSGYASIIDWAKKYLSKREQLVKNNIVAEWYLFENNTVLEEFYKKKPIDVIGMRSIDYILFNSKINFSPGLSVCFDNSETVEYCLVTSKYAGSKKRLAMEKFYAKDLHNMWLETKILKEKKESVNSFFSEINTYENESEALLSVFFNKNEFAIISKNKLEIMAELNHQIKNNINIIYTSPKYLYGLVAFSKTLEKSLIDIIVDEALSFDEKNESKQILELFKVDKLERLTENSLKNVENLMAEYSKLTVYKKKL
ncbi:MAG: hypothetical protein CVV23_00630 [Ignavibacteriae bacterium HGW-Ignavibacteriae-2]|jgi:hypothetical protein|nr:MAG: hypothetical protein CVV23_00630 [Ignavibacteriae bacterium HGW-Ignavibacteriae-2]